MSGKTFYLDVICGMLFCELNRWLLTKPSSGSHLKYLSFVQTKSDWYLCFGLIVKFNYVCIFNEHADKHENN